jgi:predicted transcriptional regulator
VYVNGLKARLKEAWSLDTAAKKSSCHDKTEAMRRFDNRDQVLVLSPQLPGKMDNHCSGPYVVEEQVGDVTYGVCTPD